MAVISRRRPRLPADYGFSTALEGMLDWADVAAMIAAAKIFWVSTVNADATPHITPIWGAWVGDAGYIEGSSETRWGSNVEQRPSVNVGVDRNDHQVMVRGSAARVEVPPDTQQQIADNYAGKYEYRPEGSMFWQITPKTVLAWDTSSIEALVNTPTAFVFEEAA